VFVFSKPEPLFNPVLLPRDSGLTPLEVLAGPYGLIAFIPLALLVRFAAAFVQRGRGGAAVNPDAPDARRTGAAAVLLIVSGLAWTLLTAGPWTALFLPAGLLPAMGLVAWLREARRRGRISARLAKWVVWLAFTAAVAPFWWIADWSWYGWEPSRMATLHQLGLAYYYLRFIAWGVDVADRPDGPLRPVESLAWLLYAPLMRLGPLTLRDAFLERLDGWRPGESLPWRELGQRFGLFILGGVALGVIGHNLPAPLAGRDFYSTPAAYPQEELALLRVLFMVPMQVYFLLWTYNELAAVCGLLVGIRVDNNFNWLPAATSVRDFWRRWHVTVGAWLLRYIYIPLGGNRVSPWITYHAVFLFCGVWHGASWSFVAWGVSQAVALAVQKHFDKLVERAGWQGLHTNPLWKGLGWLLTMHYQALTIMIFTDFDHCGSRLLAELWRRGWWG
jgi:D-alanyl-lipoteichoic acid acyltransferase DltB (MBOAT superfamily)